MTNNNYFPYVDTTIEAKDNKTKFPYRINSSNDAIIKKYVEEGDEVIKVEDIQTGKRFNVQKVTLKKQDGSTYTNMITLSAPVAEGLCLRKVDGKVQICVLTQTRTPFHVSIDGKKYARFFQEMVGGLVETNETLEEAAIREVREEMGYEVKELHKLIVPRIHKHTSYSDETSLIFYAICGEYVGQDLDDEENIKAVWYDLDAVEAEYEKYMEGEVESFFGFDMSEMFILALQRFLVKYKDGRITI